jgi:hypothetical protein
MDLTFETGLPMTCDDLRRLATRFSAWFHEGIGLDFDVVVVVVVPVPTSLDGLLALLTCVFGIPPRLARSAFVASSLRVMHRQQLVRTNSTEPRYPSALRPYGTFSSTGRAPPPVSPPHSRNAD